jgi:site-specific DNA recombinase
MPFAAIYTRCSSELQDVQNSLEAQEGELRTRAEKDGWTVHEVFSDPAESGRLSDRPAFQRMMALSKQAPPPFSRIYLWDIRRFGRNRIESAVFKQRLRSRGIEIVYLKENIDDTATGRLIEGIMESIAEYESYNIAEDTRRGHREITRRGYYHGGAPPFGLRVKVINEGGKERKGLEPDPERAHLVAWMYEQRLAGKSPGAILKKMNEDGVLTTRGKTWNNTSVEGILRNPVYIGRLEYGRQQVAIIDGRKTRVPKENDGWTVCENALEPVVKREVWDQVQKLMQVSKRGRRWNEEDHRAYLLTGSLYCSICGGSMIGGGHRGKARYYYCRVGKSQKQCSEKMVRAEKIEEKVLGILKKKFASASIDTMIEGYVASQKEYHEEQKKGLKRQHDELRKVQKELDNLTKALKEGIPASVLMEPINQLEARKARLTHDINLAEKVATIEDSERQALKIILGDIGELIEKNIVSPADLRDVIKDFVRVDFDVLTGAGTLTIFLPQEKQKPVTFDVCDDDRRVIANRSGQTGNKTTVIERVRFLIAA